MKKKLLILYLLSLSLAVMGQRGPSGSSYDSSRSYVSERVYLNAEGTKYVDNVTYLDGFGRTLQETRVKASPGGTADLIVPHAYGVLGRKEKEYLPFAKAGNNGAFVADACSANNWTPAYGAADASYAYTSTEYDGSPLDRVVKRTGAGSAWHTAGKGVASGYSLNKENEVRLYKADVFTGVLSLKGCYRAGSLEKIITTDEDGHRVETFTDNMGKTVLTVAVESDKRLETYYVYDDRDQLRWVLSPEASYQLGNTVDTEVLSRLAYYYAYDRLGRMTEKRLPGCDPIYMVYDKRDRLVLSQDGNQRAANAKKWSYSVYDKYNRIVESGETVLATSATHKQLQDGAWNAENYLPEGVKTPLQYTVYGSYEPTERITPHPFTAVDGYASEYHSLVTGLVTSTKTRVLGTDTWLTATTYYDAKCRPVQTVSDNQHGGLSTVNTAYDFVGNVLKQRETHGMPESVRNGGSLETSATQTLGLTEGQIAAVSTNGPVSTVSAEGLTATGTTDMLETVYTYDDRSRPLTATYTLNGGTSSPGGTTATVTYEYDEVGRLVKKHYGDNVTEELQYNIRGWLTSKESEAFKMQLHYETPEAGETACYNGNISEWSWQQGTNAEQLYGFTYDGASRLKETAHKQKSGNTWASHANACEEKGLTYDRNGNILTLQRTGNGTLVDNLSYTYTGNRLTVLEESERTSPPEDIYLPGAASNGTYTYDANGNQTKDVRKSLEFSYNVLNLLHQVTEDNTLKAAYSYLANGTKLGVRNGNGNTGYDYDGSFVYTVTNGVPTLESALFADGQLKPTGVNYTLTDHLGSVRAIVDANGTIQEQNDYYPFGSKHVNTSYADNDTRYQFSGKERQDGWAGNVYDFGSRMYSADMGRWMTVDPLAENYYALSLFNYCDGNPVLNVDLNGTLMSPYYDSFGNFLGVDEYGFTGDIYITTQETFDENSVNGIADSKMIQADTRTEKLIDKAFGMSGEALSNIYTDVLFRMKDIDFSKLLNGKISILEGYKSRYYKGKGESIPYGYNSPSKMTGQALYNSTIKGGNIIITVNRLEVNTLSYVEYIQNFLGVHEYYGHQVLGYGDKKNNHHKVYQLQMKHPTYKLLNDIDKKFIIDRIESYKREGK